MNRPVVIRIGLAVAALCLAGLVVLAILPGRHDWTGTGCGIAGCLLALCTGPRILRQGRGKP